MSRSPSKLVLLVSTSKSKKPKSNRSVLFKALMGKLAGDRGNTLSDKFVKGDLDGFQEDMNAITAEIVKEAKSKPHTK